MKGCRERRSGNRERNERILQAVGRAGNGGTAIRGRLADGCRSNRALATGVVVVDLNNTILHTHRVISAALVERGEQPVTTANDGSVPGLPAQAETRLNAIGYVLDRAAVLRG